MSNETNHLQQLRRDLEEMAFELKKDWAALKPGDQFPTVSTVVMHDWICELLEEMPSEPA